MRELPVRDAFTDNGFLREDGPHLVHSMLLLKVKTTPRKSKAPWIVGSKILAEVTGRTGVPPLKDGGCPLINNREGCCQRARLTIICVVKPALGDAGDHHDHSALAEPCCPRHGGSPRHRHSNRIEACSGGRRGCCQLSRA